MDRCMEMDNFNMIIISTKVNLETEKYMEKVDIHGKMVQVTKANGSITSCMVKVLSNGQMGRYMKDNMHQITKMDLEF